MTATEEYPVRYSQTYPVGWDICGASGRLSLTGLFDLIQLVAVAHAERCRFGFYRMRAQGQAWVLNRVRVRFARMPRCNRTVRATTWIHASNGILSERCITLEHDGQTFARASTLWVCIDYRKRTPQHILAPYPDYLIRPDDPSALPKARRIALPKQTRVLGAHRVAYSDIDPMGHVNNIKYTQWVLDSIPYRQALGLLGGEVEVNFLSELHPGDTVSIEQGAETQANGEAVFLVRAVEDGRAAFAARYTPLAASDLF